MDGLEMLLAKDHTHFKGLIYFDMQVTAQGDDWRMGNKRNKKGILGRFGWALRRRPRYGVRP